MKQNRYNNSSISSLPLAFAAGQNAEVRRIFILFIIMLMGVGSAWAQSSGSGTEDNPYIIANSTDLNTFGSKMNNNTQYWKLGADIDLGGAEWTYGKNSASNFKGHFDGNGKTISNLSIVPTSAKNNGFFSSLQGTAASRAEVKNLIIDGVTISQTGDLAATTTSGTLAGNVTEYTDIANVTVKNVSVEFKNLTNANYVGGFVGRVQQNNCTITDCSVENPSIEVTGNISDGASFIGGAIGQVAGSNTLITTINGLTVTSPSVTINKVSVANCYIGAVFGRINTYSAVDGVIVSQPELLYKNSANTTVAIHLGSFAGGIAGIANPSVETAVTNVTVTSAKLTLGTENNSYVMQNMNAGLIGQASTNVRLERWTVDNNVQVNTRFTNASSTNRRIGAFAGYLVGTNAAPLTAKDITINSSTINVKANLEAATYIGGFAGLATTNAFITNCTSKNSTVTVEKDMTTGASYIGGAIGDFLGGAGNISTINGLTVENPSVTIDKVSIKDCCVGGVFGRINNYTVVNNADAVSPVITYNNANQSNLALNIGSYAGYITGSAQQETAVTGVDITGTAQLNIGTTNQEAKSIRAGAIGYITTNVRMEDCSIENTSVQVNGSLTSTTSYIGGFAGYLTNATNAPVTINGIQITGNSKVHVTGNITVASYLAGIAGQIITASNVANQPINISDVSLNGTASVLIDGDVKQACYLGGFAGNMQARAYAANTIQAEKIKLNNVAITVSGQTTTAECYYGGMAGRVNTSCTLTDWSVLTSATITIGGNITTTCNIGGAFGRVDGSTNYPSVVTGVNVQGLDIAIGSNLTTTLYVGGIAGQLTALAGLPNKIEKAQASGNIRITGSHTFLQGNKTYAFGGIVGYMGQSGTTFSEVNQCVSEVSFDLGSLTPATSVNLNQNGLVVGGVIGRINTPSRLPESLYYSGKINAPFSVVGPLVGVFLTNIGKVAYVYDDYSGENASNLTSTEWDKVATWFYNGYKIGLSSDLTSQTARTKNYKVSPDAEGYINVTTTDATFTQNNKIVTAEKNSYTVLAYTANNAKQDYGIYPQWTTDNSTYPAYYMYYMQGVNRGNYTETPETTKTAVLGGTLVLFTFADDNADLTVAANRGFAKHTLRVTTSGSGSYSYQWYVDGAKQSGATSATYAVTPAVQGSTVKVEAIGSGKVMKTFECKIVPVFRVGDATAAVGTKTNPYLLGSADELQLLSHLSTLPSGVAWEKGYDSNSHYNKAYYKMDGDVDLSAIDDFAPIGLNKAAYSQNFIFDGVFDGDRHIISGLKETWYGGIWNTDDYNVGWGLFAYVGNPNATVKVGDTSASNTVIKNLIIDGATLTHDPNNTSFYYNSGTSGKTNNCVVGVLAGIVSGNTTIQNIEIRNSKITDEGSSNYNLATRGLFVGGAIGSLQNAFNATANVPANTNIDHIAAQVDITLEKPTFADATATGQLGLFNIGGIIGRYCATSATQDQAQANMPAYTFYSGSINAPKAWISPVLGALRYASQQSVTWANYSKIWEGNNNSATTQLTITNAQYYNFRINGTLMTELNPEMACKWGARPIVMHTDASDAAETYNAQRYQGVNYSARFIDSEGTTLYYMNQQNTDYYWIWESGFPHMTDQQPTEAYLDRTNNSFTANMILGSATSYQWKLSYDGEIWEVIDDATEQTFSIGQSNKAKYIVAIIVTSGGVEYRTQAELVPSGSSQLSPYVSKTGDSSTGYTFSVEWLDDIQPSILQSATYQWYHSDKTTPFDGETGTSLSLSQSQLESAGDYIWCEVVVRESGTLISRWMLVAGNLNVVYVNGNGYTGSDSNGAYGAGNDTNNNGRSPQTPVKTIDKANSLLDGGPWDKNIIVVMGTLNSGNFRSKGSKPATLTGKWDGTDYNGILTFSVNSDESGLNTAENTSTNGLHNYVLADTKFENITFKSEDSKQVSFHLHGHDVWFGKGIRVSNFQQQQANHGNIYNEYIPDFSIILEASNLAHPEEAYWTRTKPQIVTIESGHYGRILGGRIVSGFFNKPENTSHSIQATAQHPSWAVININIDPDNDMKSVEGKDIPCDVNVLCAGLTDGSLYEDMEININGGIVNTIIGANQGNAVVSGNKTFTPPGGLSGNYGQWPNSSFFGRTVINVEQDARYKDIRIRNLYGGAFGRSVSSKTDIIADMYTYGRTQVNLKSGTVTESVYGAGAGGVMGVNPWDPRMPYATDAADNVDNAIINGVQYGTWGEKKEGSPLADVMLHILVDGHFKKNADGTYSTETEAMNLANSSTTLNLSGGSIGQNVYGGGDGKVAGLENTVALQGIGSIFATTNVNISGNVTIGGNVYGGCKGTDVYYNKKNYYGQTLNHIAEMNGTVNIRITGEEGNYPTIGGDIYGAGLGLFSTATEEYPRVATTGNSTLDADDPDKYKTDIHITIDMPESVEFPNDIYGGGALGLVDGNTNIILKRGTFTGNIYGGGYGEKAHLDKAMVTGNTYIYTGDSVIANIDRDKPVVIKPTSTTTSTIYGGGNMAQITGNTFINLWHGNITADVFGGGKGLNQAQSGSYTGYGKVTGNTRVLYNNITENNLLTGNIYGGGALGAVQGNTTVVIKAGEVDGDVFGGGQGEEGSEKAKVTGNTNVIVDKDWTEE